MNVLMHIDSFVLGGAQRQFINLAVQLSESGFDVSICTYYPIQETLTDEYEKRFRITCFDKSFKYDLSPAVKLGRKIREEKSDVVIAFLATPSVYAELSRFTGHTAPVIVSERNGPGQYTGLFKERALVALHTLANKVVFNNYGHRNDLIGKYNGLEGKSLVIYNGVNSRYFRSNCSNAKNLQVDNDSEKINKEFKFCVVSARPIERKGLFDLIDAIAILKSRCNKAFSVDWIGGADESNLNVQRANTLLEQKQIVQNWCWKGVNKELHNRYSKYDAILVPSRREGVSNALCEAMACGLPCIASDIVDHRTVVYESGAGILFEVQNATALAESMEQFINADAQTLAVYGRCARTFAETNFSMERYTENWCKLIKSVVK